MARYTRTDLEKLVDNINTKLAKGNSPHRLRVQSRNGYIGIDLFKNGIELHMIASGKTSKEAAMGAMGWAISNTSALLTV